MRGAPFARASATTLTLSVRIGVNASRAGRYSNLNQSEPLRIQLFGLIAFLAASAPDLARGPRPNRHACIPCAPTAPLPAAPRARVA
jgi:hypothetical protein